MNVITSDSIYNMLTQLYKLNVKTKYLTDRPKGECFIWGGACPHQYCTCYSAKYTFYYISTKWSLTGAVSIMVCA